MPRRGCSFLAAVCCSTLLSFPSTAAAQKDVFVEGFLRLNTALAGTYGDEGPQIIPAIETMARGLAGWDRSVSQVATRPADLHFLRAVALDASGRSDSAGEAFRAAFDLDRDDPLKAYSVLQHGTSQSGPSSSEIGQRALDTLTRAYERLAEKGAGQPAVAFPRAGLLDDRPLEVSTIPHAGYADAYRRIAEGEYQLAIAQFRRRAADDPLVADPASRTPMLARAGEALRAKRLPEARAHLDAALSLAPASSEAQRMLGLVEWLNGQDEAGIQHLEAAVRANPRDERSRLALARVFARAGRDDDAERTLHETVRAIPGSALAHWWLASDYERLNRIADARRELALIDMASVLTNAAAGYAALGRLSRHAGDSAAAGDALVRRARATPNDPAAHLDLADVYLDQDRLDDAFRELAGTLLIDPDNARAHAAIGRIQLVRGQPDKAARALGRALALMPADHEPRYALAMALRQLGRDDEAAREIEAFHKAQQQSTADRRTRIARDVLEEAAKLTGAEPATTPRSAPKETGR